MRLHAIGFALLLGAASTSAVARETQGSIFGVWANPNRSVDVEMKSCGESLCGVVVWASPEAKRVAAAAGTDPLVGVELLSDYRAIGPRAWEGTLFVPDLKGQYSSRMDLVGPDTVEISGCALGQLLCKTQTWTRLEQPNLPTRRKGKPSRVSA